MGGGPAPADCCPLPLDSPRPGSTAGFGVTGSCLAEARAAECFFARAELLFACCVFVRRVRCALALVDVAPEAFGRTIARFAVGVRPSVARAFSVS